MVKRGKYRSRKNILEMMSLDVYLSSLPDKQYQEIAKQISPKKKVVSPLMSWEYFMMSYANSLEGICRSKDLSSMKSLQSTHQWKEDPSALLSAGFDALVLTDSNLVIEWVNPGFTDMTGYSADFAIGKTPRFLQGEKTSQETRKYIRENIQMKRPFKAAVVNYREDGLEYHCELNVFPLTSQNGEVSHFLALETELAA
jgi:PAS domain S-box-containing protein